MTKKQISINSPEYHLIYLKHNVKTYGVKNKEYFDKYGTEYEWCSWRECECGAAWFAGGGKSYE